jgi:hypothetical protein
MASTNIIDPGLPDPSSTILKCNEPNTIIIIDSLQESDIYTLDHLYRTNYACAMFPYHYYITRDGKIYQGREDIMIAPNLNAILSNNSNVDLLYSGTNNEISSFSIIPTNINNKIFICMEGNSSLKPLTELQYNSLSYHCKYIKSIFNIKKIYGYNELNPTVENPGIYFKMNELKASIDNITLPDYIISPSGTINYTFGKRKLVYNSDDIIIDIVEKDLRISYLSELMAPKSYKIFIPAELISYSVIITFFK